YPELVLTTTEQTLAERPELVDAVVAATGRGYDAVVADPQAGLDALVEAVPELEIDAQRPQLQALLDADALGPGIQLDAAALHASADWEAESGIVGQAPDVDRDFNLSN